MKHSYLLAAAFWFTLLALPAQGQTRPLPPPGQGPAPLLYVRFLGPKGMKVTLYQGQATGREFTAPVTVGLRPGYLYRLKASHFPDHPGKALYPTLEVRNTLALPPRQSAAQFPAPVLLSDLDIDRALAETLITKVVYLEDPDQAEPKATESDQPLETTLSPGADPMAEARSLGRPVLVFRMGGREMDVGELQRFSIPNTILFPDEKVLMPPRVPPCLAWNCLNMVDPLLGPKPFVEECLHDGGDSGQPAGYDRNGKLYGLNPSDTVAEYRDNRGKKKLAVSNRVCICVPRFALMRTETPLASQDAVVSLNGAEHVQMRGQLEGKNSLRANYQDERLAGYQGRRKPSATVGKTSLDLLFHLETLNAHQIEEGPYEFAGNNKPRSVTEDQRLKLFKQMEFARKIIKQYGTNVLQQSEATSVVGRSEKLDLLRATVETRDITLTCNEVPRVPAQPLHLIKWADKQSAQVGDLVTFSLKYSNSGGEPITEVAVTDSLTGRLEYVPGSSESSRDAVFTTEQNEAGSVILRWEVTGKLLPGQSGTVRFQAKVR